MEQPRGIQWTLMQELEDPDFANDVSLLSHTMGHMQAKTKRLEYCQDSRSRDQHHKDQEYANKCKSGSPPHCWWKGIEKADRFTYLGSTVSKTGGTDEDIKTRINKAHQAFATLRPVWRSKNLSSCMKLRLFISNVKSVLLYGPKETWRHTRKWDHKLQVFINICLNQILRIRWPQHISNQELCQRTGQEPITDTIQRRKWRWIGHTICWEKASPAKHWTGTHRGNGGEEHHVWHGKEHYKLNWRPSTWPGRRWRGQLKTEKDGS